MDKNEVLKQYFGHSEFRPGQGDIIDHILAGQDCLGVMPTGAGKSVCFQVPALMFSGTSIVISPLISLMKDQVEGLRQSGVNAAFINSSLDLWEYRQVLDNASYFGRVFARSGGLAVAVEEALKEHGITEDQFQLNAISCNGISECKAALLRASKNVLPNNFIEGMACEGGCVNGPAKISDVRESVGMRRQLMLSVDDRSIADNLEMSDFKEIDMKDGRD